MKHHDRLLSPYAVAGVLLSLAFFLPSIESDAEIDPQKNTFTYSIGIGIDESLAQIAQFLIKKNRVEGGIYTSQEVEKESWGIRFGTSTAETTRKLGEMIG